MTAEVLCECGCGLPAPVAKQTDARKGHRRGQVLKFRRGHHRRMLPKRPKPPRIPMDVESRFLRKIRIVPNGCWEWTASAAGEGYGAFKYPGGHYAHRYAYERVHGPIPAGLVIDHLCRNRLCVNPRHLQAVTQELNTQNRATKGASASGVRGVHWDARTGKWQAKAAYRGRTFHAGRFDDIESAAKAASELRLRIHSNCLEDIAAHSPTNGTP